MLERRRRKRKDKRKGEGLTKEIRENGGKNKKEKKSEGKDLRKESINIYENNVKKMLWQHFDNNLH